jgi:uridine kinase
MLLIGISGGSGSGKTTFVKKILSQLQLKDHDVSILHMDSYYLPQQPKEFYTEKGRPNYDHPNAFDWDLLRKHLLQVKKGQLVESPIYSFADSMRLPETKSLGPSKVVLFEGIFTLYDKQIRDLLDIKCFLQVDADIRLARRLRRDIKERGRSVESVIEQYYDAVRPMYLKFLAPQMQFADFIVGEHNDVAGTILTTQIRDFLRNGRLKKYTHEDFEKEEKDLMEELNTNEIYGEINEDKDMSQKQNEK